MKECLCWQCDKACNSARCSYVANHKPTKGMKYVGSPYQSSGIRITDCPNFEPTVKGKPVQYMPGTISLCESVLSMLYHDLYYTVYHGETQSIKPARKAIEKCWIFESFNPTKDGDLSEVCRTIENKAKTRRNIDSSINKIFRKMIVYADTIDDLIFYRNLCSSYLKELYSTDDITFDQSNNEVSITLCSHLLTASTKERRAILRAVIDNLNSRIDQLERADNT